MGNAQLRCPKGGMSEPHQIIQISNVHKEVQYIHNEEWPA